MFKKLKEHIDIVLGVLEKHDPYGLAKCVNKEEYNIEAVEIANRAKYLTQDALSKHCREVFKCWLYDIEDDEIWKAIAHDIINKIK